MSSEKKQTLSSVVNCVRRIQKMARSELELPREDLLAILKPIYIVSSFIGHRNKNYHPWLGKFGLVLWISNIFIHFSLDFYDATYKYGWAWATAIAVFLISFLSGTFMIIRDTIPWIEDALEILYVDGNFTETLEKARKVAKVGNEIVLILKGLFEKGNFQVQYLDKTVFHAESTHDMIDMAVRTDVLRDFRILHF